MQVWVARLRDAGSLEDNFRVLSDIERAHEVVEHFAALCGLSLTEEGGICNPDGSVADAGWHPETERVVWFESPRGSARIEGPVLMG